MGNCSTEADTTTNNSSGDDCKSTILENPTGDISLLYNLGRELGRGQFGITYLCTDIETSENYACKSISKAKLITERDVEDVRNEVEIMKYMPEHLNIVSFKGAFEDDEAVHIVMELCEGGELFDRIDARSRYTERDAAAVMKTILKVVQVCLFRQCITFCNDSNCCLYDLSEYLFGNAGMP